MIIKNPTMEQVKEKIVRVYCEFNNKPYDAKLLNKALELKLPAYLMLPIKRWSKGEISLIMFED